MKKLHLSPTHKLLGGVLGGLGEYLTVDPVVMRLIFIVLLVATGLFPGVILYLIAWVLIPQGSDVTSSKPVENEPVSEVVRETSAEPSSSASSHASDADDSRSV